MKTDKRVVYMKLGGRVAGLTMLLLLSACGGGSSQPVNSGPNVQARTKAASQTANENAKCTAIQPFYWEIGDSGGVLTSGTAGGGGPNASTSMLIASSSKWVFGAFLIQMRGGALGDADIKALTLESGYTNFSYAACLRPNSAEQDAETVDECFHATNLGGTNADFDASAVGKFYYGGGHFQKYADVDLALGQDDNASLTATVSQVVGTDFSYSYDSPQLAAGIETTSAAYGLFLRKILAGHLLIRDYLGSHAVCTNPATCSTALYAPVPSQESWHYSLAHWVEDDPAVGDGSFSSPGAFGFYPWIDASKTYYGLLGRYSLSPGAYVQSVDCGRLVRKAWLTAVAQ